MPTPIPADVDQARRRVREMLGETDTTSAWEAHDIDLLLGDADSLEAAAALGWEKKAARYAELVDISESGSSRKNSQLRTSALEMHAFWQEKASETDPIPGPAHGSRTRPIERV